MDATVIGPTPLATTQLVSWLTLGSKPNNASEFSRPERPKANIAQYEDSMVTPSQQSSHLHNISVEA